MAPKNDVDLPDRELFCDFLREQTCYDMLPNSYKLIIFDTTLMVKKAFYAMVQNEIRAAPLWDSTQQRIVGMLTVTDFVNILRYYHYKPDEAKQLAQLEEHQIQMWRDLDLGGHGQPKAEKQSERQLVSLAPSDSLYDAARMLVINRIHRIPLLDPQPAGSGSMSVVGIITQIKLLRHISINFKLRPDVLKRPIGELRIGTFQNLATARMDTPLIQLFDMFVEKRLSAIPIVDDNGILLDVYEKYDVSYLAMDGAFHDLNMPVREALAHRIDELFGGVQTCMMTDTLSSFFDALREQTIYRLIVVDPSKKLLGIISVSDILAFLICV